MMALFSQFVYGLGCGAGFCVMFKIAYVLERYVWGEEEVEDE